MKRLIIEPSGRTFIRTYKDTDVDLSEAVMASMAQGSTVTLENVMQLKSHDETMNVGAKVGSDNTSVWVISLRTIRFTTGITSRDGVVSLNFESPNKMEILWRPPADMALSMLVTVYRDGPMWWCDKCYLVGYDRNMVAYRLPVANVFDDTSLCTGDYNRSSNSISGLIAASYNQFRESPWNADLYSSKADEFKIRTSKMFRWRAADSGFEQADPEESWQNLCIRVGNDTVDKVAQLAVLGSQAPVDAGNFDPILDDDDDGDGPLDEDGGGDR